MKHSMNHEDSEGTVGAFGLLDCWNFPSHLFTCLSNHYFSIIMKYSVIKLVHT